MKFLFKKPSKETQIAKSKIALESNEENDFEKIAIDKLKAITNHQHCYLTNSGNASIYLSLFSTPEKLYIPDQGAWTGFKQIAKILNKEVEIIKTNQGIIDINDLNLEKDSTLILTSFAGYSGEQDIKAISRYCHDLDITLIEDASGGICDNKHKLGNGNYSDIIIGSTGSPKLVNVGNGGFITFNNPELLDKIKIPHKICKCDDITSCGIATELDFAEDNFKKITEACKYLKNNLYDVIHPDKRGLNVIIKSDVPKELTWDLKKELPLDYKSFFTKCPNYNRVKEKAVA
ncbi:DegT/DnrJ/EryC1/StrS family aminotransferase, partial [Methanobrevibacter sp. OttesenSCG-928-I08]|nr:DegT/DnrJ/EryC1/StrS family aminotransferase [Methanobrevibacter sp. OttesenSCG-928-I08]